MFETIAIIGAGALGSYYGARLARHGRQVHFLMRSDAVYVRKHGLQVYSHDGDFSLKPEQIQVHDDPASLPKVDLVVVTLKTTANDAFAELITPALRESTTILTLQNGLGSEEQLAELFGEKRIVGGLAFICTNRTEPGVIRHTDYGFIKLGEYQGGPSPRASALSQMFNDAKVPCSVLPHLQYGRWEKLVWNIPFNGLGAAMDATTDILLANPTGRQLVADLMAEVMATAAAVGINLPADTPQKQIERTLTMGAYQSSMQVDRRAVRPMEVEAIVGKPLSVARSRGVSTPILQLLHRQLVAIDSPVNI